MYLVTFHYSLSLSLSSLPHPSSLCLHSSPTHKFFFCCPCQSLSFSTPVCLAVCSLPQSAEPQKTLMLSTSSSISWFELHADAVSEWMCVCVCACLYACVRACMHVCVCGRGVQPVQYPWEGHILIFAEGQELEKCTSPCAVVFLLNEGKVGPVQVFKIAEWILTSSQPATHTRTYGGNKTIIKTTLGD